MLDAIHEATGKEYQGYEIWPPTFLNPYEEKWICCPSCKHKVTPVKSFKRKDTLKFVSSHFRQQENETCTKKESDEHRRYKILISNLIENKEIVLKVDNIPIPWNELNIKEIKLERGEGGRRADVRVYFNELHGLLGKGIVFEIQLSKITPEEIVARERDWLINGLSLAWIKKDMFDGEYSFSCEDIIIDRPYLFAVVEAVRREYDRITEVRKLFEKDVSSVDTTIKNIATNAQNQLGHFIDEKLHTIEEPTKDKLRQLQNDLISAETIITKKLVDMEKQITDAKNTALNNLLNLPSWTAKTCRTCKYGGWKKERDSNGKYTIFSSELISCFKNYDRTRKNRDAITIHEKFDTCDIHLPKTGASSLARMVQQ